MAARVIIAPTTSSVGTTVPFRVQGMTLPGIVAPGLGTTETVSIFISVDGGISFSPVQQGGSALELTATNNMFAIDAAGLYGVQKSGTTAMVGVFVTSDSQV